jgi:hypothetical protein
MGPLLYAVAFFRISHSILRRLTSARKRERSICSGVMAFTPAGLSLPALAAFTQLRKVCSTNPRSSATRLMLPTAVTRLTACSLNSAVYACFGILNIFVSL